MGPLAINLFERLPLAQRPGSFWLPSPSSTTAPGVDSVFYFILTIAAVFFALVVGCMVLFVVLYRKRPGHTAKDSPSHHTFLELSWTILPLFIVGVIFYQGFAVYMDMAIPPANTYDINVTAFKWGWAFQYPETGVKTDKLHVPKDEPVRLIMRSQDVIHSLSIPSFRVKMDCVPGRYTYTWFEATDAGEYDLYCTEYCGKDHFNMLTKVVVHETRGEFEAWMEEEANFLDKMSPVEAGKLLYERNRCNNCHSLDGTASTGPTFMGMFGEEHKFTDGSALAVDHNYIRESIVAPQEKVRAGYQGVMPTYKGLIKDAEIDAIIEFLKTVK